MEYPSQVIGITGPDFEQISTYCNVLTYDHETRAEQHQCLPVADALGQGIDQDGRVASDVVHEEEEDAEDN